jgi:hypothetical protein
MKFPSVKRKARLLIWTIFLITGLLLNAWAFIYYIGEKNNWRIYMTALWIVIFTIALVSTLIKYRNELGADNNN